MASTDPAALDYWAAKYVLVQAANSIGHTNTHTLDPGSDDRSGVSGEAFGVWLNLTKNEIIRGGYTVTTDETHMNVYLYTLVDTTPPLTTISLGGVLGNNDWFTSDVTVTLSASDDVEVNKTEYRLDNDTWTTYTTPFEIKKEGITIISYRSADTAGNMETIRTETVKIDTTIPYGDIKLNNDANYTVTASVMLTLSATDVTSGVAHMRFSHDNIAWTSWEAYSSSKTWTLTLGNGTKIVYAQFRDGAGLVSASYQDTITLLADTTRPVANAGADQTVDVGETVTFDASGSSDNVNIVSYEWDFGDGGTGTGVTTNHTYDTSGTYIVTLSVKDEADNIDTCSVTMQVLPTEAFPVWIIGATAAAVIGVTVALAILLAKRKQS
ncbi:MAG: PKD domain-containing protein [Candidatus Bathyarchaeota archaeon]|nr:MAG: PKD domain-containing protein [Candidatus Bathyarchaeota archaeon]